MASHMKEFQKYFLCYISTIILTAYYISFYNANAILNLESPYELLLFYLNCDVFTRTSKTVCIIIILEIMNELLFLKLEI